MLTLTSITTAIAWLGAHIWALALLLVPQVLAIVQPVLTAILEGLKAILATIWEGASKANFATWMLALAIGIVTFGVGYHYGWIHAIDWGHEHFRWIAKKAITPWWKFW